MKLKHSTEQLAPKFKATEAEDIGDLMNRLELIAEITPADESYGSDEAVDYYSERYGAYDFEEHYYK